MQFGEKLCQDTFSACYLTFSYHPRDRIPQRIHENLALSPRWLSSIKYCITGLFKVLLFINHH